MRTELLYLNDILEAADAIERFVGGVEREQFVQNDLVRSAVLHKLTVIGEAATRISQTLRQRYHTTEWADIVGLRNIVVHAYFGVDWYTIWVTATSDVPKLRMQIADIIAREFPAGSPD